MINEKVGIVVLNYRNYEDTISCLRALADITYSEAEIIVVDNDSQNESLSRIQEDLAMRGVAHSMIGEREVEESQRFPEKTILIESERNRGYSAGNNIGIRAALIRGAAYVLILNNDTVVEKVFLEPLVEYAQSHLYVGAVGPKVLDCEGRIDPNCARRRPTPLSYFFRVGIGRLIFPNNWWIRRHYYTGEYYFDEPREVDILSGCCILVKREVFDKVGLLDEKTFLFLEEFILHERLRGVGLASAIVPQSNVIHKHGRSIAVVSSDLVLRAARASRRYYLTHYRKYNRLTVATIVLFSCTPQTFLRRLWEAVPGCFFQNRS